MGLVFVPRTGGAPAWNWALGVEARKPVSPAVSTDRAEYRAGQVVLTTENTPRGLALKWVIAREPSRPQADPRQRVLAVFPMGGSLVPSIAEDGQSLDLIQPSGGISALHVGSLRATDAAGRALRVQLAASDSHRAGLALTTPEKSPTLPVTIEALVTGPSWTLESNQADVLLLGASQQAAAADVNGDGYSDVLIGAPYFDTGVGTDSGKVLLFAGSATGLSSSPSWTFESDQPGARVGNACANIGDVNGDGFVDVAIGATMYNAGAPTEGKVWVFHGSATGLPSAASWSGHCGIAGANYGNSAAGADVNGDGYADLIVGAPEANLGYSREGAAYVYLGSASGLGASPVWTARGNYYTANMGATVAGAGDINGDGYGDVVIGANQYYLTVGQEGGIFVWYGSPAGLTPGPGGTPATPGTADWGVRSGQGGFPRLGATLNTAGDVNGDGYSDVVAGAVYYDVTLANEGKVWVFYGSPMGLPSCGGGCPALADSVASWSAVGGQADAAFGQAVTTAGDTNGDGYADLLIGAYGFDTASTGSNEGKVFLYLGSATGLDASPSWTAIGSQAGELFGTCVAGAGDVNGDGFSDFIAGAEYYSNGETHEGRAYLYSGGPLGPEPAAGWTAEATDPGENLGISVASAGDVNGDGYSDAVVGAYGYNGFTGKAYLYFGGPSGLSTSSSWTAVGESPNGYFGSPTASAGDVNGDGYGDVIIGAPSFESLTGKCYLYLGGPSGLSADPTWTATGPRTNSYLGWSVATAGDVNGDGYSDVIIGAGQRDTSYPGTAYLYLGGPSGLSATADWTAYGESGNNAFGESVASAGDVDGDGYSDVVIGASRHSSARGKAYLYLGGVSGLSATPSWTATGESSLDVFGSTVASAGDIDGDGYSDVAVSSLGYGGEAGRVFLYSGGPSGLSSAPSWTTVGEVAGALFGRSLGTAGDVNGDGYSDLIVGEEYYLSRRGRAHLFLGGPSGLSTTASWTAVGENAGDSFSYASAAAGDVNGDGFSDVLVGAYYFNAGKGKAYLYYGGGGGGISLKPQQRRYDDSVPIAHLGKSDSRDGFRLAALGRSPFGRGKVRLQTEVKPFGTPFDGTDLQTVSAWSDTGTAGVSLANAITPLASAGGYHWRARLLYDPIALPFQHASRWFSPPADGWTEMDLRLVPVADVLVSSFTDSPDPIYHSQDLSYSLTVGNSGPDPATGASATVVLNLSGVSASFLAASSDPLWSWDAGTSTLSASLGTLGNGASTTLGAVFTITGSGSVSADSAITSSVADPDGGNNIATTTTSVPPSSDFGITTFSDSPDPVIVGSPITYSLAIINTGSDASSVTVAETFTPTGAALTFVPGSSDGRWVWDSGTRTLTAALGPMASSATDSLSAVFTASAPGSIAAHAVLTPSLYDPDPANNSADASTVCCVIPGAFDLIHPVGGVSNLATSAVFYWQPSAGAGTYDLRLGTTTPPPLHTSGLSVTETTVTGLIPGAIYYWDIEARTPCGSTLSTGGPRSFTTSCPTELGRWPDKPYGTVRSSAIGGDHAYYGNGLLLTVLDISDPAAPALVKEIPLPGEVDEGELLVESGYLFLPLTAGTLKIYDLADPVNPAEIASLGGFAGLRGGMEFYGGLLYLADQIAGLRVVSLSPITAPSIIGSLATSHARDVTIYEKAFTKYAYVVDAYDGLTVMNVTNPASPSLIRNIPLGEWGESVARSGEFLFVADAGRGLKVFSIANPTLPVQVGIYPSSGYMEWVSIHGATAYACDGQAGLIALNISTPASPTLLGEFDTPGNAMHVVLHDATALVGDDSAGLRVLNVANPAAISELSHEDRSEGPTLGIWTDGLHAIATRWTEGLATFDVSAPAHPAERAVLLPPSSQVTSRTATVSGTLAFVSNDYGGLGIVDISDYSSPTLVGSYDWGDSRIYHSAVADNLAYVAAGNYGLAILDVSNPSAPAPVGRYDSPGNARFVVLYSGFALLADSSAGLRVVDVSNPGSPTSFGSVGTTGSALAVAVSGTYAYVAAGSAGLRIIDLNDLSAPTEVGFYDTPGTAQGVEVWGSMAIVADGAAGVHLLDVSDPTAPAVVATLDTPGGAYSAHLMGYSLYVADGFGFLIENLATCSTAPPGAVSLDSPIPTSVGAPCGLVLDWGNSVGAYRYDLYFDTANPPLVKVAGDITESRWTPPPLTPGTTYHWRVVAKNGAGETSSAVGTFTTAPTPGAFSVVWPPSGDSSVGTSPTLSWNVSAGAQSYSLHFGTSDPPPLYASGLTATSQPLSALTPGTTYRWFVVAETPCGSTPSTGGTATFSTQCATQSARWPAKPYGPARSSAVYGNYAYAGIGLELAVLDLSNPSVPVLVREVPLPGEVDEGEPLVASGYLYLPLTGAPSGTPYLQIYSLADPALPLEVGRLPMGGLRGGMQLVGSLLYVADGNTGLKIVDVADPTAPVLVGSLAAPLWSGSPDEARDVMIHSVGPATYAYVAYFYTGVQAIDVSTPSTPALLTTLPLADGTECVGRTGDTLVAGGATGVTLYSLAVPAAPSPLTTWLPPLSPEYYVEWIALEGATAWVCDDYQGLLAVDLSSPATPALLGSVAPRAFPMHVSLSGTLALVSEEYAGLTILDVSDPAAMSQLAVWDSAEELSAGIVAFGGYDVVARSNEGFGVIDVAAPPVLSEAARWELRFSYLGLSSHGSRLFAADRYSQLYIFDLSAPASPSLLGTYAKNGYTALPSADGTRLYYATGAGGLHVVDVSDPALPVRLGRWLHPSGCTGCSARSVAVDESTATAYVADAAGGLRVISVADPAAPVLLATAPTAGTALGVAFAEGRAFVLSAPALEVFDVSSPASPTLVASLPVPGHWGRLDVSGSVAAVGTSPSSVLLIDLGNPSAPSVLGSVDTPGMPIEARIVGNALHVADRFGVVIEDLASCCSSPPVAPTLFSPADGAPAESSVLKLDWSDPQWVLRYDLYLDTNNPPSTLVGSGIKESSRTMTLVPGTTYYWRVVAHSPCGATASAIRSFTTSLPDLQIALAAEPEPVLTTRQVLLSFDAANTSVSPATGVQVAAYLSSPPGEVSLAFEPAGSDPLWSWDGTLGTLRATLGSMAPGASVHMHALFTVTGTGTISSSVQVGGVESDPDPADNVASISSTVVMLAVGNRVWRDDDADGIQDPGEPGLSGAVVDLYDSSYNWLARKLTDPSGAYLFTGLSYDGAYIIKFFLPSADYAFSPPNQGGDDDADSDADTSTGQTSVVLQSGLDPIRWDCGMVPGALCYPPDELLYIYSVTETPDGQRYPILNFMDPNQSREVTGYNIYRSHNPALPHSEWAMVASDVVDMDEATLNKQWIDTTGEVPPEGQVWYYEVAAYNHICPAQGPW